MNHPEIHKIHHIGWLRAAVLGANDGIVSTASLILGVAATGNNAENILIAGVAGLVAGAMSMAAGEYVSVQSQADTEKADINRERQELATDYDRELAELTAIYRTRGVDAELAPLVASQLMTHDALDAHTREELGISTVLSARPLQAAFASAGTFAIGALLPLVIVWCTPRHLLNWLVSGTALMFLALLGALAARTGGAPVLRSSLRVTFWGALAMGLTSGIGALFGVSV